MINDNNIFFKPPFFAQLGKYNPISHITKPHKKTCLAAGSFFYYAEEKGEGKLFFYGNFVI